MIRLFVSEVLSVDQTIRAPKEHQRYLEKVMRLPRTQVKLFNNKDGEFFATYTAGEFHITSQTRIFEPLPPKALAFGLIKSHRLSWLIEKSCELGVTELFPLMTQHVQFPSFKPDRYQRILIEAAEQCGRITLPVLHEAQSFNNFIGCLPNSYNWRFGSLLSHSAPLPASDAGYVIGPEGGFSEKEEQILIQAGAKPFSMGPLTLRAETAGLWCLSQFA